MLSMLLAYDAAGNVTATLDHMVAKDENGDVIGLIDFGAHEQAGGRMRDVWDVEGAVGSGTWPEWLGGQAHSFRVELAAGRIAALVHTGSGHRRVRADVEAAIEARIAEKAAEAAARGLERPEPADIRDLVGGPDRPLLLDEQGRTKPRTPLPVPRLPVFLTGGKPQG